MWRRYGFVAAPLQSGTTGNYIGLACKAADAGYKLIVVLTGNLNLLRIQTQMRVDEGFLGFDTQYPQRPGREQFHIGAGCLPGAPRLKVISLTTSGEHSDFGRQMASSAHIPVGDYPVVLVIKKNLRILQYVRKWIAELEGRTVPSGKKIVRGFPALVIDADADNTVPDVATANEEAELPRTNAAIRHLLDSFEKCAYVGYTRTPFTSI